MTDSLRKLFPCCTRKETRPKDEGIEITTLTTTKENKAKSVSRCTPHTPPMRPRPAHIPDFRAASERQQSDPSQSQSEDTQPAKPKSLNSSTKPDSDPDEITPANLPEQRWDNVSYMLEDRRSMLQRLRNLTPATGTSSQSQLKPQELPAEPPKSEVG